MKYPPIAIITGATSGIGAEYAKRLAGCGYQLILTGRRETIIQKYAQRLECKYSVKIEVIIADFSNRDDVDNLLKKVEKYHAIEFLINNAGLASKINFCDDNYENQQKMIKTHIDVPTRLMHSVIPRMECNGKGYIINISSIAAFLPSSSPPVYAATKAYLNTFSEAISIFLRKKGIKIQVCCPGYTRTDFHSKLEIQPDQLPIKWYQRWMTPEQVVNTSLQMLQKNHIVVIPGFFNKILISWILFFRLFSLRRMR